MDETDEAPPSGSDNYIMVERIAIRDKPNKIVFSFEGPGSPPSPQQIIDALVEYFFEIGIDPMEYTLPRDNLN